ncbi:hypothetical protein ACFL7D_06070 [candidate division KSB1 bacterium]
MIEIKNNTLEWLLEEENQPVRYLTLKHLMDEPADPEILNFAKQKVMDYEPTQKILESCSRLSEDQITYSSGYQKYMGLYWQIIFLGSFLADSSDKRARDLCEKVLRLQSENGGFRPGNTISFGLMCLTGNVIRALINMGYSDHPGIQKGLSYLAENIIKKNGVPCTVIDYSIYDSCNMTAPKILRTFASVLEKDRTSDIRKAISILTEQIYNNRIFRYVRTDSRQFYEYLDKIRKETKEKITAEDREKYRIEFVKKYPDVEYVEKKGWKKFGFPLNYNTDILEVLAALVEAGDIRKNELEESIQIILDKKTTEDRWILENSLNNKMIADVEVKKQPGKWITFYCLYVLNNIEGITFTG